MLFQNQRDTRQPLIFFYLVFHQMLLILSFLLFKRPSEIFFGKNFNFLTIFLFLRFFSKFNSFVRTNVSLIFCLTTLTHQVHCVISICRNFYMLTFQSYTTSQQKQTTARQTKFSIEFHAAARSLQIPVLNQPTSTTTE